MIKGFHSLIQVQCSPTFIMASEELSLPIYYYSSTSSYPLELDSVYFHNTTSTNLTLFGGNWSLRHSNDVTIALITAYSLVFLSGAVGNALVICVIVKTRRMCTVTNLFLLNLAVADLLVTVFCLPCTLLASIFVPWILGEVMCKAVSYIQGVSVCASVYSLVAVSFDRFLAIRYPLKPGLHLTIPKAKSLITFIWVFSMFLTLPWLFVFNTITKSSTEYCLEIWPSENLEKLYFIIVNLILYYILPFVLISYFYTLIWLKVLKRNVPFSTGTIKNSTTNPSSSGTGTETHSATTSLSDNPANKPTSHSFKLRRSRSIRRSVVKTTSSSAECSPSGVSVQQIHKLHRKTKISVLKMLTVVISVFLISWLPLYMIFTWFKLKGDGEGLSTFEEQFLSIAAPVAQWLGSSNSCINPIIYNFLDKRFRRGFREVLYRVFSLDRRSSRLQGNSMSLRSYNNKSFRSRSTFRS